MIRPRAVALALAGAAALAAAPAAGASTRQFSIIQDPSLLISPVTGLSQVRALGPTTIRVFVSWYSLAPHPRSTRMPKRSDWSDPDAYPSSKWAQYDTLVRVAQADGIRVDLELTGGVPRWAEGPNPPPTYRRNSSFGWRPNVALYGDFVHAVTERYDGSFTPPGATGPLPAVHFWSFWNEPNFGQDLGPQATRGSTVPFAPARYRALLRAGWTALHRAQPHARNTTLIGELAATGYPLHAPGHPGRLPGETAQTSALQFLRAVYCVDDRYRPLRGATAARFGCPKTTAGSRRFRARNPALFDATGFADHPYSSRRPPNASPAKINRDYATFPVLRRVARALDQVAGAYGSHRRLPIYNDEYGYLTSPPQPTGRRYPSQARAAAELNQAEYLSYRNPRVASYAQYLLDDPAITAVHPKPGFSSGLYTSTGAPKSTLDAFRLPVWLPRTKVAAGARAEVWGSARPATFAPAPATAEIQARRSGLGSWTTIRTVAVARRTGYFDVRLKLPYTGQLRLAYTYPANEPLLPPAVAGSTVHSRTVNVTVTH